MLHETVRRDAEGDKWHDMAHHDYTSTRDMQALTSPSYESGCLRTARVSELASSNQSIAAMQISKSRFQAFVNKVIPDRNISKRH